jgi:hypothetical protein
MVSARNYEALYYFSFLSIPLRRSAEVVFSALSLCSSLNVRHQFSHPYVQRMY